MADYPQPIQEYTKYQDQVQIVNDIFNGSDTARKYIKKFTREDNEDYQNRIKDCTIDNYVFNTVDARKNIIFRRPINLENITNAELKEWCEENIDNQGTSLNEFGKEMVKARDRDGFCFVIVDTPKIDETIQTRLDEQQNQIRPYAILVERKDLFYWEVDQFGNYTVIAFNESYEEREDGLFNYETKTQVKVMFSDGRVMIFRDDKLYDEYEREVNELTIVKFGNSDIPMFYDMAKLNIKQLNRESEHSNYTRVSLAPFPIAYGNLQDGGEGGVKTIAVNQGLHFTDKQQCGFEWAEMSGQNYDNGLKEIERLGAIMETQSISFATESNNKTATQVEKEATIDESRLTDTAQNLEDKINEFIQFFGLLRENFNVSEQVVEVNKDFSANTLSPEQTDRLIQLRLNGDLSYERLMTELEKGEILTTLTDEEQTAEKQRLLDESVGGGLDESVGGGEDA